jgi:hypothetical protein
MGRCTNYDHLLEYRLPIVGETNVRIVQSSPPPVRFGGSAGCTLTSSLNQCLGFRRARSWKVPFLRHGGQRQDAGKGG